MDSIAFLTIITIIKLEGTVPYMGFLLATAEGFKLWPRIFFGIWENKSFLCDF